MSVDDRLRTGLAANARRVDPDCEILLAATVRRHERRRIARWVSVATVAAAAAAALVLVLAPPRSADPPPLLPADPPSSASDLLGRYAGQVAALPSTPSVAGRWVLEFHADGRVAVSAPAAYGGVLSGVNFDTTERELRIDLFQQDLCSGLALGRYGWATDGSRLALTVAEDPCGDRATLLATTTWSAVP